MIERLVNVLADVGFELTYEQIADALWLAKYLPRPSMTSGVDPSPVSVSGVTPSTPSSAPDFQLAAASPAKPVPAAAIVGTGPAPGELFVPKPGIAESGKMRATPIRVPATEALPNKAGINAALRPLKRRFPSTRTKILDVTATIEQIANGGPAVLIMKPAPERWLEVALIVDESASMGVWRETINEFAVLLARHGSFRDVRLWYANLDGASLKLYSEAGLPNLPRRLRHPKELIDPTARRLILVVSDCVAPGWRNGAMFRTIRDWGRRGPLTLVQVLPERLWNVTALGDSTTRMRAYSAGAANFALQPQRPQFRYSVAPEEEIVVQSGARPMPMPVVNLEGWSLAPWAKLVANVGDAAAEGVTIPALNRMSGSGTVPEVEATKAAPEPTAADRIRRFRSAASPGAKELAGYLAAAPLYLPVMRLVQRAMMPSVRQVDLAEVLLGGLLQQVTPAEEVGRVEDVFYEFFPGVRELLQDSVRQADQVRVLREVSRLIESQTGSTIDFAALLSGDSSAVESQNLYPMGQKFAEVASNVVSRLGWPGAASANTAPSAGVPAAAQSPAPLRGLGTETDLTVVIADLENKNQQFRCEIFSPHLATGRVEFDWVLPSRIDSAVDSYIQELVYPNAARAERLLALRGVGRQVWDAAPEQFKDAFWKLTTIGKLESIAIISDEHYFPWELAIPYRQSEIGLPLGVSCAIGRWPLHGSGAPPTELAIKRSLVVAPEYQGQQPTLKHASAEVSEVLRAVPGKRLERATVASVSETLRDTAANLIHIIAHAGTSDGSDAIFLEDGRITAVQLLGSALGIDPEQRRLFYLSFSVRHPALIRAFIGLGATAIVAPLWDVKDDSARQVAAEFYSRLAGEGQTHPAAIVRDIRSKAYESGDDTYAAFRFYGNPAMQVTWVPEFPTEIYISYAALDDAELIDGHQGWVSMFFRALEVRVSQLLGRSPRIFFDRALSANGPIPKTSVQELQHVVAFVSIVSPVYLKSETCRRELAEFTAAARSRTAQTRMFKVLKTPVPLEMQPPELRPLLGYEFFNIDPDSGRVREFDMVFGPEAQRDFRIRLDDVAHDIARALEATDSKETNRSAWTSQVNEYNRIRESEPPGELRTTHMTEVVGKMRRLALEDPSFDVLSRLGDRDRGWRLAAYAFIYEHPEAHYFDPLGDSLLKYCTKPRSTRSAGDNRPFGDYWGLMALEHVTSSGGILTSDRAKVLQTLSDIIPVKTDRRAVLDQILARFRTPSADQKQQGPNTAGREGLLMWMAELDTSRRRPVLVVDGPARSGKTTTIAILSSAASQFGKFDVVSIDLSAAVYRDVGVEEIMRDIARRAEFDAQSLPRRAKVDRDDYWRYAIDWLVGNVGLRRKPTMLVFDNLDSPNISSNVRGFVDLLMQIGNRAPNLILVFLGYHSVDIPTNARQHVFIEHLTGSGRPNSGSAGRFGVLVVGTGSYRLPKSVELAAREVGSVVAASGCRLITGGWQGVDHVAARAFTESLNPQDPSLVDALVQVVDEPQKPDFKGGSIVRVPHNKGTSESLKRSDLVILIGGAGGTWQAFREALAANKLVLPLMSTGTDAQQAAILLEILGQYVPSPLIRADFADSSAAQAARLLLLNTLQTVDVRAATRTVDNSDLLWMVSKVLPLADEYLRKKVDFDEVAKQILQEFESHELPSQKRTKLVVALIENHDPAWRITGYLAIEARHSKKYAELLMASLEKEVRHGLERIETRPLWRWLSAIRTLLREYPTGFPHDFTLRLEELARTLQGRPDVDPGGQCKRLLGSILQMGKPAQNSIDSRTERRNRKKKK